MIINTGAISTDMEGNAVVKIRNRAAKPAILAPAAINVALYRPYLWEVRNPLMLLASLEGLALLIFTIIILFRIIWYKVNLLNSPAAWFSLVFSLTFAFAVGISTYNFGTLFRYKLPLMPFFAILIVLAWRNSQQVSKIEQ